MFMRDAATSNVSRVRTDTLLDVPPATFQLARKRVEQWGTNDYYGRWGRWLLQERFERPVKPFQP